MAPKTANGKGGKNRESDICSLLQLQKPFRYFQAFSVISLGKFSHYGIVQERFPERKRLITINSYHGLFQIEYYKNLCQTNSDIFVIAKMRQRHFFLTFY